MDPEALAVAVLDSLLHRFRGLKRQGDGALAQCGEPDLKWRPDLESNSVLVIVQHLHGNMQSRWTNFLTADGDKPDRDRDGEFVERIGLSHDEILRLWEEGWTCLLSAIEALAPNDLLREVRIRGQALTAIDAIERQLAHVGGHVGQIVWIAKYRKGASWSTLSISRGQSRQYTPSPRD